MSDYDFLFKVIVVGDGAVGKTALVIRFSEGRFQDHYKMTIGVDFAIKMVEIGGKKVKLQIWDTGGQERFSYIRPLYYKGAMGVIYVFDITNRQSFDNVEKWRKEVTDYCAGIPALLVANKCDLPDKAVTVDEANAMGVRVNGPFYEASAKTGDKVDDLFTSLARILMQQEGGATVPLALRASTQAPKPAAAPAHVAGPAPRPMPSPAPVAAPTFKPAAAPAPKSAPAPKPVTIPAAKPVAAPAPKPVPASKPAAAPAFKPVAAPAPKAAPAPPASKDTLEEALAFLNEPGEPETLKAPAPAPKAAPAPYSVPEPTPVEIPQPEYQPSYSSEPAPPPFTSRPQPAPAPEPTPSSFTPFAGSSTPKESTFIPFLASTPQSKSQPASKSSSKAPSAPSPKPLIEAPKTPAAPQGRACPNCGKFVSDRWKYCTYCGNVLK
jgi:small GTP-binding protein